MPPEDNPADDIQPTKEEWEAFETQHRHEAAAALYEIAKEACYHLLDHNLGDALRAAKRYRDQVNINAAAETPAPAQPKKQCINWPHNHAANGCG